jgi:hypothetical protein
MTRDEQYDLLYNIIRKSRDCIDKYLTRFDVTLETCEQNSYGQIKGTIKLIDRKKEIFGILYYDYCGTNLFIDKAKISKNKRGISVKLLKVVLLYLIALYIDKGVKHFTLRADPTYGDDDKDEEREKNKKETCLACYYEIMGFSPDDDEYQSIPIQPYLDACINNLPRNYKNSKMCLLCECQNRIKDGKFRVDLDFKKLKVDMNASISDLIKSLKSVLKDMSCYKDYK